MALQARPFQMRFGKFHGIALMLLGAALMIVQGLEFLHPNRPDNPPVEAKQQEPKTSPLPAILGGIAFVAGVVILIANRQKPKA